MRDLSERVKSMKVTVCFGRVRVVVPCADGSLSVGELQDKAISRFHKATGRPLSEWIHVRKLITSPDGAILDPNDRLRDVVDDRDQIIAIFEDHSGSLVQQRGDGTSGSSMSASSPEMFHDDHVNENDVRQNYNPRINETDVIITSQDIIKSSKLKVRRGSEPALNLKASEAQFPHKNKRNGTRSSRPCQSPDELQELDSDSGVSGSDTAERKKSRTVGAKDAQLLEFADGNITEAVNSDKSVCKVREQTHLMKKPPTSKKLPDKEGGFAGRNGVAFRYSSIEDLDVSAFGETEGSAPPIHPRKTPPLALQKSIASGLTNTRLLGRQILLQLVKGPHGLGFTVTTRDNPAGGNCPIYVKNIKPQGAAIESGLLQPGDRLLQVNDIEVTGKSQSKVVSILRGIPEGSTVDLVISRQELLETSPDQPQQIVCTKNFETVPPLNSHASRSECASAAAKEGDAGDLDILVFDICLNSDNSAIKGLGVKLKGKAAASTPKDTKDVGLFIKSVIVDGAAAKDGRLQPDDQLLEVNGECLLNQTNTEATRILRFALQKNISPSGYAKIIVARKKDGTSNPQVLKNNHATATLKTEEQGQKTSFHKEPTTLQQKQNAQVSSSRSLHNLSYHEAVDSAAQTGISPVAKNSMFSTALNGDHDFPDRTRAEVKRSQTSHNAGNSDSEKNGSRDQLNSVSKNLDVTQDASSSDSETRPAFQREGFGRQSMSEKRKGHLDPRTTEVYQKIRQNKGRFCSASLDRHKIKSNPFEDISTNAEETEPSLSLTKSTSLESLKTVAYQQGPDPATEPSKGPVDSQGRPCGSNNSFRAAVDRSYEKNFDADEIPLNEDEIISSDKVSNLSDRPAGSKDLVESQGSKKDKGRGPLKVIGEILRLGRKKKDNLKPEGSHSRSGGGSRDEVKANSVKISQQKEKRTGSDLGGEQARLADKCPVSRCSSEPKPISMNSSTKLGDLAKIKNRCPTSSRSATPGDEIGQLLSTSAPSRGAIEMESSPLDLSGRRCSTTQERVSTESPAMNRLMQLRQEHQRHHQERQHRYPLDAQEEEYERRLRELEQQQSLVLERENRGGSPSVQYRARADMPPGSRNPYLERPMSCGERPKSCGSHYQNIDIVRSQLQLHDEYQLRYQAQLMCQQQILQRQQQQLQQQPVTIATQPPIRHQYSKSYSSQPVGSYLRSASPAVSYNYQATAGVLQNREAINMVLPKHKHIPGPLQNQEATPLALQSHKRAPGPPLQICDDNTVGLKNFEFNSQAPGNYGNVYDNQSYKWNDVRDLSRNHYPSGSETDQRPNIGHRRYYSGFASHSQVPKGSEHVFLGHGPSAWKAKNSEHYYSRPPAHSVGQRADQMDRYKY